MAAAAAQLVEPGVAQLQVDPSDLHFWFTYNPGNPSVYDPCAACLASDTSFCPTYAQDCMPYRPDTVHFRMQAYVTLNFNNDPAFNGWTLTVLAEPYPSQGMNFTLTQSPVILNDVAGAYFQLSSALVNTFKVYLLVMRPNSTMLTYTFIGVIDMGNWPTFSKSLAERPIGFGGSRVPQTPTTPTTPLRRETSLTTSTPQTSTLSVAGSPAPTPSSSSSQGLGTEAYTAIGAVCVAVLIGLLLIFLLRRRIFPATSRKNFKSAEQIAAEDARRARMARKISSPSRSNTVASPISEVVVVPPTSSDATILRINTFDDNGDPVITPEELRSSFDGASWISASYARGETRRRPAFIAESIHSSASARSKASRVLDEARGRTSLSRPHLSKQDGGEVQEVELEEEEDDDPEAWRKEGEDEEELREREMKVAASAATAKAAN